MKQKRKEMNPKKSKESAINKEKKRLGDLNRLKEKGTYIQLLII